MLFLENPNLSPGHQVEQYLQLGAFTTLAAPPPIGNAEPRCASTSTRRGGVDLLLQTVELGAIRVQFA
jgi:hypothetical protein